MSQFPQPGYYDPTTQPAEPATRSGLAVTALVMSLIGIIPCLGLLTAPIGVLLGLIGLVTIKRPRTGRGMAATAVLLGVVFTAAQVYLGKKYVVDPLYGVVSFVMKGPTDALQAGFAGDTAGFKAAFQGAGATTTDAEAQAFIGELRNRYGEFVSASIPQNQQGGFTQPQPGQTTMAMPYEFRFANKTVSGEAELIFTDPSGKSLVRQLGWVRIIDAEKGDMTFPASAAPAPSSSSTPGGGATTMPGDAGG